MDLISGLYSHSYTFMDFPKILFHKLICNQLKKPQGLKFFKDYVSDVHEVDNLISDGIRLALIREDKENKEEVVSARK